MAVVRRCGGELRARGARRQPARCAGCTSSYHKTASSSENSIARSSIVGSSSSRSATVKVAVEWHRAEQYSRKQQQSQCISKHSREQSAVASSSSRRQSQSNSRKHEQQGKQQRDGAAARAAATRRGERERRLRGRGGRANARRLEWRESNVAAGKGRRIEIVHLRVMSWPFQESTRCRVSGSVGTYTKLIKRPGARDGERSFGCHPTATRSRPRTLSVLRGQGPGMVNVLLAAMPTATRSRPRAIKGQEPGLVDVLLQPPEQTRSRRKAEVVNELLWVAGPKERSPSLAPGP